MSGRQFVPIPDQYEVWRPATSLEERLFIGFAVLAFIVAIVATWLWGRP